MQWNEYKERIIQLMDNLTFDPEITDIIKQSITNNQRIFIAGNGGSSSIANHYCCDFSKGATPDWKNNKKRFKVISLCNNVSYMTAIANDENYQDVFKEQLINLAEPNDILMVISSSGNSPNVVVAAEYAKKIGMITIGITGFDGGKILKICDYNAHVSTDMYETAEDVHSIFGHFLSVWLRETLEQNSVISLLE
jgi:D-sedoheptulose 7-phosphate isomerase